MEQLQVPTRRIEVDILLTSGGRLVGHLFLSEAPFQSGRPEDVIRVLNDERAFLPFAGDHPAGLPMALNKEHIVLVQVESRPSASLDSPVGHVDAEGRDRTMLLTGGHQVTGDVCIDTPPSASRLVDKLNLCGPFLALRTVGGYAFVHRRHIVHAE
jgi:hypothetical protein